MIPTEDPAYARLVVVNESIEVHSRPLDGLCIICDDELGLDSMVAWHREVHVNGQGTGYGICQQCAAMPPATLAAELQEWVDEVIKPYLEAQHDPARPR